MPKNGLFDAERAPRDENQLYRRRSPAVARAICATAPAFPKWRDSVRKRVRRVEIAVAGTFAAVRRRTRQRRTSRYNRRLRPR